MKKLFTIAILLIGMMASAQSQLSINIAQDARLAILGDDKGNDAFTPNLIFRSEWQGLDKYIGYGFIYPEFEIAELKGGTYRRYSMGYGRTFYLDKLFNAPLLENFKGTFSVGYGFTDYNGAFFSADFTSQLSYKLDKIKIRGVVIDVSFLEAFISWQIVERKDLAKYGESLRGSGSIGLKYYFFDTTPKR